VQVLLPKVNQILYLHLNSIDEEESKEELKSRVSDIQDQYIIMQVPLNEKTGKMKRLYVGDELSAYYVTDGGVKNYFMTSVLGFRDDVTRMILVKKPELDAITQVQRRTFLRVPAELELALKITEQIQFIGLTDDVGGGGISFICPKHIPLQVNTVASCWLLLSFKNGKVDHVPFKAELVRVKQLENETQLTMLRYTEINDRDRQKIIRFCFERQLEFRKN
jgi:c-di-GMP-binding flagellar brake protein YcgR